MFAARISPLLAGFFIICFTANSVDSGETRAKYQLSDGVGSQKHIQIATETRTWILNLIPNHNLRSLEYAKFSDRLKKGSPHFCEYHGKVHDTSKSWAAISLCNGISGVLHDGSRTLELKSYQNVTEAKGFLTLKIVNKQTSHSKHCDLAGDTGAAEDEEDIEKFGRSRRNAEHLEKVLQAGHHLNNTDHHSSPNWKRYIEVWIVVDQTLNQYWKSNHTKIHQECLQVMNIANSMFGSLDIHTVLVGVEIWTKDLTNITEDHIETLRNFKSHRQHLLAHKQQHDYTILLTGVDFHGQTIGYAYINAMCHFSRSAAVVQYERLSSAVIVAGTIAHEIGHGLGALHDTASCQTDEHDEYGIMIQKATTRVHWSNCTKMYISKYIDRFHCLRNIPNSPASLAVCGNGVVDSGEQCDCGVGGLCTQCCSMHTCKLKAKARCGSGDCCNLQTCSPYPAGTICRSNANECDLPEYCSGKHKTCPKNVYKHNGFVCDSGKGHCFNGTCGSSNKLCEDFINPAAKFPQDKLLKQLRGNFGGEMYCREFFCQTPLNIGWIHEARSLIRDQDFFRFHSSPLILFKANQSLAVNRPTTNGIACGHDKMCVNLSCVDTPKAVGESCRNNCSNNGICNSNNNCHCFHLFAPPTCSSYGHGGSVDSGHRRNPDDDLHHEAFIFLVLLFVIIVILLACCMWTVILRVWNEHSQKSFKQLCPKCASCYNLCCFPCIWLGLIQTSRRDSPASSRVTYSSSDKSKTPNYPVDPASTGWENPLEAGPPVNRDLKPVCKVSALKPTQHVAHIELPKSADKLDPGINHNKKGTINKSFLHDTILPTRGQLTLNPAYLAGKPKSRPKVGPKPTRPKRLKQFPPDRLPKPSLSNLQKSHLANQNHAMEDPDNKNAGSNVRDMTRYFEV